MLDKLESQASAVLEYVFYNFLDPATGKKSGRYGVFFLYHEVSYFEVGDADEIHAMVDEALAGISSPDGAGGGTEALYLRLIAPVESAKLLKRNMHLYIAPDRELFRLPFELLTDAKGKALMDKASVSYISTGRDLLRMRSGQMKPGSAAIVADPQFNVEAAGAEPTTGGAKQRDNFEQLQRKFRFIDIGGLWPEGIAELPGTALEAEVVRSLLAADIFTGSEAKKSVLQIIEPPDVLHIATHGFYKQAEANADPFLNVGLLMAGAQPRNRGAEIEDEFGDGILNGRDVMALNLNRTSLVVLSACETGKGTVLTGEGIQGLRRAFELAGVKTIICTLWKTDDMASAVFMSVFYENFIKRGIGTLKSLNAAKCFMRTATVAELRENICFGAVSRQILASRLGDERKVRQYREVYYRADVTERPYSHPFYWAGFVLQGDT